MDGTVEVHPHPHSDVVLPEGALAFLADLERRFGPRRAELLDARVRRQAQLDAGVLPSFPVDSEARRAGDWTVAPPPKDLDDRRVEITGPVERKMMINALNSGASVFMADFEDATSPTWDNLVEGQLNVRAAYRRELRHDAPDGRQYRLAERTAVLCVRPRGWHLDEKHLLVDGRPMSASLFDFGLTAFHNAREALDRGTGPYFYLPKLEGHLEARLWNDVMSHTEDVLGLGRGAVRATVLIETILAAFEMDEILYELREHSAGLNAGRWDYIFSVAKRLRADPAFVLPDRASVTMTVPFMRAYTELLVATCHRRGAHAIGGMAAFIPSRRDPERNAVALERVRADKRREADAGFDGTWVAHPDLVPIAREEFDRVLGSAPNQVGRQRDDVAVTAADLLAVDRSGGSVSVEGLQLNVDVGVRYLASWLSGTGAAAIHDLMEDAATAEISRAQIWQWAHHGVRLADGTTVTPELVRTTIAAVLADRLADAGDDVDAQAAARLAAELFDQVALADDFVEFLTLPAYAHLD